MSHDQPFRALAGPMALALAVVAIAAPCTRAQSAGATPSAGEALPLGDGRLGAAPRRGYLFACRTHFPGGGGAQRVGEWIRDGMWYPAEKPEVEGRVPWPDASVTITRERTAAGERRVVRSNGLPRHTTGEFPIQSGTRAYQYDRNPNAIRSRQVLLDLPAHPQPAPTPGCVPMGMIGVALSGAALFNAVDAEGRDAPAHEIQDHCNGHPERAGRYHYHDWSSCLPDPEGAAGRHSSLVGYMLDGFPIFGPRGEGGRLLTNDDLDACHGHTHVVVVDGVRRAQYHYHFTLEYPYTIGCFTGAVAPELLQPPPSGGPPPPGLPPRP